MDDDNGYVKNLSLKSDVLIPKLKKLSVNQTGRDDDLNAETSLLNEGDKLSQAPSHIIFISPAVYVERSITSQNFIQENTIQYKQHFFSFEDCKLLTSKPIKYSSGSVYSEDTDRVSPPCTWEKICEPNETLCDEPQKNNEDINEELTTSSIDTRTFSVCSSNEEENSSLPSEYEDDFIDDTEVAVRHTENTAGNEEGDLIPNEQVEGPAKSLGFHSRSYSDIGRQKDSTLTLKATGSAVETNLNSPCSTHSEPKKVSAQLSSFRPLSSFPEKHIKREIQNSLSEEEDKHFVLVESKELLSHKFKNSVSQGDLAWFQWFESKLTQEKKLRDAKRSLESKKEIEEETERAQKLQKQQLYEENFQKWKERKDREIKARKEQLKMLEFEKEKKLLEQRRIKKMAKVARDEWNKRKLSEKKGKLTITTRILGKSGNMMKLELK